MTEDFLRRQFFDQSFTGGIGEVVEEVAGLNAQTRRGPVAGLWTRMHRFDVDDLDVELGSYRLVKANLMRGTVHLVTRRQYVTWRRCLQPMLERTVRGFTKGIWDAVDHDRLLAAGAELLHAYDGLTRAEIGAALVESFPHEQPRELGFAVRMLCPVVQVADETAWRPAQTRYILAEQAFDDVLADEAVGSVDLVSSFQRAFGPATAADAGYWSGVSRLARVASTPAQAREQAPRRVFVLPEFDNVYFCRKVPEPGLVSAKKRLMPSSGQMRGSLVAGGEVSADWVWDAGAATVRLRPWRELEVDEMAEFDRFRVWCEALG